MNYSFNAVVHNSEPSAHAAQPSPAPAVHGPPVVHAVHAAPLAVHAVHGAPTHYVTAHH